MAQKVPEFCDFDCPHAGFPSVETAGICRTMSAVFCKQLKRLVNKNRPCVWHGRRKAKSEVKGRKH